MRSRRCAWVASYLVSVLRVVGEWGSEMNRNQSFGCVPSLSTGSQFNDSESHDPVGATSAARIRRAVRFALEPLEGRVLLSAADPLLPNEVTAIKNGLKNLS